MFALWIRFYIEQELCLEKENFALGGYMVDWMSKVTLSIPYT